MDACPAWLDADAKRAWRYIVPWLEVMKILTRVDRDVVARYCQTYSRWKRAELFLQKYGDTYPLKDENGKVRCFMPWPQVSIAHQLGTTLTRLEQELGLTPSARTRIDVGKVGRVLTPRDARTEWVLYGRGDKLTPPLPAPPLSPPPSSHPFRARHA